MNHKLIFSRVVVIFLLLIMITSCTKVPQTATIPTSSYIKPSVEASPTLSVLSGEKTIEPTIGNPPTLQSLEVITPNNARDLKQLEYWENSPSDGQGDSPVAFSPAGNILATGGGEAPIQLYNLATGKLLTELDTQVGFVNSIVFSPDGKLIAAGGGRYNPVKRGVQVWDTATQEQLFKLTDFEEAVRSIAFSPDGAMLATADGHPWGGKGSAMLWDVKTGKLLTELTVQGKTDQLYIQSFSDIAFNPDGTLLAAINADGNVQLWDVKSHKEVGMMTGVSGEGSGVAFSPDGKLLAASGSTGGYSNSTPELRFWNVATGELLFKLEGNNATLRKVTFSPNGKLLASTSLDSSAGRVKLWDVETGQVLYSFAVPTVTDVAFSPDGTLLATGGFTDARLWGVPEH
jgi:WD40 repeat protein